METVEYEDMKNPYTLYLKHRDNEVVLKYNKSMFELESGRYQIELNEIMKDIDRCIKKSRTDFIKNKTIGR